MTDTTFEQTIGWNRYWSEADEDDREGASPSARFVVEPMREFLAERGPPSSFADAGCGAAALAFDVATRYPDATVVGYDAAEPVLAENRSRGREREADVRFERVVLPAFDPDRRFDVVACFYALCYVADVDAALRALYDAVELPGRGRRTAPGVAAQPVVRAEVTAAPDRVGGHGNAAQPASTRKYDPRFATPL